MRCLNCLREIPDTAKVCEFCEAAVGEPPTEEEFEMARHLLSNLTPDLQRELMEKVRTSETADELVNSIFVGDCPKCGSTDTGDCENDPEIKELLVGRCYQCGQLWCTECLKLLKDKHYCECWDEDPDFEAV